MAYVGPWTIDQDSLEAAIREWVEKYHPTEDERDAVDAWVERAADLGPYFVGTQDSDTKKRWFGVPEGTNIVIEYFPMVEYLQVWFSEIRPRD